MGPPDLSIVIPAFNEQWRILPTVLSMIDYFDRHGTNYEILVVNDGSTDTTSDVVMQLRRLKPVIELITLNKNSGKGAAVRKGMLQAKGKLVLFADADGATPIEEIERLTAAIEQGADVAFGSRAMASQDTKVTTWLYRKLLGRMFHLLVYSLLLADTRDTQCGFKLFRAQAAKDIFEKQKLDRFSFDVEILYLAQRLGYKIQEVPVNWANMPGSKVNVVTDGVQMMLDILRIKYLHRALPAKKSD